MQKLNSLLPHHITLLQLILFLPELMTQEYPSLHRICRHACHGWRGYLYHKRGPLGKEGDRFVTGPARWPSPYLPVIMNVIWTCSLWWPYDATDHRHSGPRSEDCLNTCSCAHPTGAVPCWPQLATPHLTLLPSDPPTLYPGSHNWQRPSSE